ncbi:MAG: hypothetical protein IT210_07960 [Armatimonadetes bacterium]|nr:hypothetical protein [Armatimonadota bacterium]
MWLCLLVLRSGLPAQTEYPSYRVQIAPGSDYEKSLIAKEEGASVSQRGRTARSPGFWVYRLPLLTGGHARLTLTIEGSYDVTLSENGITYNPAAVSARKGVAVIDLTAQARKVNQVYVRVHARAGEIRMEQATLTLEDRDSNRDGVGDSIERLLGLDPAALSTARPVEKEAYTSFQTGSPYRPEMDIHTGAAIVYSSRQEVIQSWQERGYRVQTMYGFRAGGDYLSAYPGDGQTDREGKVLDCGPGSFYLVPTERRLQAALSYFREAIENGTTAVCPEEPEFFARAGYSAAFKEEWQKFHNAPWEDPASSIDARYRAEQLKAHLELKMIASILQESRRLKPAVKRMVAFHSPINYADWGIVFPHSRAVGLPELDEVIGQVWTGTARTPSRYRGEVAERVFETAFLEYSSLVNLTRDTGKKLWFLMDPVEDNPDRPMEDYHLNYERTLTAALMFPQVARYEVMPWPERVFGRVPDGFATEITTVIRALEDMRRQQEAVWESGSQGIAALISDSLMYQREAPSPSDFDALWGMTLPLLYNGIPVEVAQLDRAAEPGYLNPYRVLLLSYDAMKPLDDRVHEALAEWVKGGGALVFFGGTDAYNGVQRWWKARGLQTPQEDLFARLGAKVTASSVIVGETGQDTYAPQIKADQPYRNLENRRNYSIDLTSFLSGDVSVNDPERVSVYVKFQDAFPDDGWGAWIRRLYLSLDNRLGVDFLAGTQFERRFIFEDGGSAVSGDARFTDGDAYVVYKFEIPRTVKSAFLTVEMGNQFLVKATGRTQTAYRDLSRMGNHTLGSQMPALPIGKRFPITAYETTASRLYSVADSSFAPAFEVSAGRGKLIVFGIAPRFFAQSDQAARIYRAIVRYASEQAGMAYREQPYLKLTRGRYIIARTFSQPLKVAGPVIDLLDPALPVLVSKDIPQDSWALLYDARSFQGAAPDVMYCSSALLKKRAGAESIAFFARGPLKTKGVARLHTGGRLLKQAEAFDALGHPVPIETLPEAETLLLRYDNLPDGVVVKVTWGEQGQ